MRVNETGVKPEKGAARRPQGCVAGVFGKRAGGGPLWDILLRDRGADCAPANTV